MKTTGRVNGIISNIVIVKADGAVAQNEICYVYAGDTRMMAEVIKVIGDAAYVQVFDSTRGLKIGDRVEFEGHMLEATLAPGLLSRNYDGLQNDLEKMEGLFIARGSVTEPIDFSAQWEFTPLAAAGDKVSAASWLGEVKEQWVMHKIMVPFTMTGTYTVKSVAKAGKYNGYLLEGMACPGGCINGGGQPYHRGNEELLKRRAEALYAEDAAKPLRKSHENPDIQALYEEFLGEPCGPLSHELLHTRYYDRKPVVEPKK